MVGDSFAQTMPMNPCCIAWYGWGHVHGIERGREQAYAEDEEEAAAIHHRAWEIVQANANEPTHEELEKRRRTYTRPEWADAS